MSDADNQARLIYVRRSKLKLGVHETARTADSETYYEAQPMADGRVKLNLLDMNDQPTGLIEVVDMDELEAEYEFVPDFFATRKTPQQKAIEKQLAQGREHLDKKEFHSAEYEFDQVIRVDKRNLDAHLGKGEALIGLGDAESAREIFDKVAEFDELYEEKNKHIFNRFAITMREKGFYDQAETAYLRALAMDPKDENLYYNMARTYFDKGDLPQAAARLKQALQLNPDHAEARALLATIYDRLKKE